MSITDELREWAGQHKGWHLFDMQLNAIADRIDAEHDESMAWDRVRKAEVENAKIREELEAVGTAAYLYGRTDLKADNAKLRELVEDMLDCIEIRAAFGRPPTSEMYEEFARRADEMGIEVD